MLPGLASDRETLVHRIEANFPEQSKDRSNAFLSLMLLILQGLLKMLDPQSDPQRKSWGMLTRWIEFQEDLANEWDRESNPTAYWLDALAKELQAVGSEQFDRVYYVKGVMVKNEAGELREVRLEAQAKFLLMGFEKLAKERGHKLPFTNPTQLGSRVSTDADLMAKSGWHWKMERTVRGLNVHEFTKTMEEHPPCERLIRGPLTGSFDNFRMRLESRLNDTRYDFLLKPRIRGTSSSLSALLRDFVGLGDPKRAVTIIDLSTVPFDVRPTVSAQIGRLAFEFNYWNPQYREFPILLLCEEAHVYIPRASESQFSGSRKSMERIAKEGRKYGVGLGVVSQRPHELSETVLAQCGTFICLRITNPDDQAYIRRLVPESEGDLTSVLAGLGRGEGLVLGEAVPLPIRVKFNRPSPVPNSDDVDFYEKWKGGPDDLDVDKIAERWRSQER